MPRCHLTLGEPREIAEKEKGGCWEGRETDKIVQ